MIAGCGFILIKKIELYWRAIEEYAETDFSITHLYPLEENPPEII